MRADRLIAILLHLQNRRMTAKELSQLLEVSERTIYRDIDALCSSGVPIQADSGLGGGFTLPAAYRTKVDGLTTPEIHALFLQMNEEPFKSLGIGQSMKSAWLKLFHSLEDPLRDDAEWIRNRVFLDMGSWRQRQEQVKFMKEVQQAVWEQRCAVMVYNDRFQQRHEFELEPYGLVMKAGMWFVAGLAAGEKMGAFRLFRLESFQLMDRTFERREGFDLEAYWLEWLQSYESRQFQYRVTLRAAPEALDAMTAMNGAVIASQPLTEGGIEAAEDWIEAQMSFEREENALSAVLSQGAGVQVLAPPSLRGRLGELASSLAAYYTR